MLLRAHCWPCPACPALPRAAVQCAPECAVRSAEKLHVPADHLLCLRPVLSYLLFTLHSRLGAQPARARTSSLPRFPSSPSPARPSARPPARQTPSQPYSPPDLDASSPPSSHHMASSKHALHGPPSTSQKAQLPVAAHTAGLGPPRAHQPASRPSVHAGEGPARN